MLLLRFCIGDSIELLLKEELGKGTAITWDKFKETFDDAYFLEMVKDQKKKGSKWPPPTMPYHEEQQPTISKPSK